MPSHNSAVFQYLDIRLITPDGCSVAETRNDMLSRLHDIFSDAPKNSFALAFPEYHGKYLGEVMRVFGQDSDLMEMLERQIKSHFFFRDYTQVSDLQMVPANYDGPYVSYETFRVPSKNKARVRPENREYRLRLARQMPYLRVTSNTTGHTFQMTVQQREVEAVGEFKPNQYGLGSARNTVAIPAIQ